MGHKEPERLSNQHEHPDDSGVGGAIEIEDGAALIDPRGAILLSGAVVAETELGGKDGMRSPAFALEISGNCNGEERETKVLAIMTPEGAAMLTAELVKLSGRATPAARRVFTTEYARLLAE